MQFPLFQNVLKHQKSPYSPRNDFRIPKYGSLETEALPSSQQPLDRIESAPQRFHRIAINRRVVGYAIDDRSGSRSTGPKMTGIGGAMGVGSDAAKIFLNPDHVL